jgi:peptidoglycan/LPS O-acetylase OafA/YrhL
MAYGLLVSGAFLNEAVARHDAGPSAFGDLFTFAPDFMDMLKYSFWGAYLLPQVTPSWNSVLWTMPFELGGSFMLFLMLAVVRRRWLRLTMAIGLSVYWSDAFTYGYFYGFLTGYCLAELLVAAERSENLRRRLAAATPLGWACLIAALACSMWLQNISFGKSRLYYMLQMNLIGTLTVVGVILAAPARAWLANRLSLFLGRISFGMYLTHLLIICSFSSALFLVTIDAMPYWAVVVIVGGLSMVVVIGTAYLFTLLVEERLLRWLKRRIIGVANISFDALANYVRESLARIFA